MPPVIEIDGSSGPILYLKIKNTLENYNDWKPKMEVTAKNAVLEKGVIFQVLYVSLQGEHWVFHQPYSNGFSIFYKVSI